MLKKGIVPVLLLFLLFISLGFASEYEVRKKAGEYSVLMAINRNPPISGENELKVLLTDAWGKPVHDAVVAAEVSMPPMLGMPMMLLRFKTRLAGDFYAGRVVFCQSGAHNVELKITRNNKVQKVKYNVDVR
jgi:hypothetical protein